MSNQNHEKGLVGTSDGYVFRITADERYLYFHKLFRESKFFKEGRLPDKELGRLRLVKAEIENVECKRERGRTVIEIHHSGLVSRLGIKGEVNEDQLFELFSGLPMKVSLHRHYSDSPDQQELRLLWVCFVLAMLRILCNEIPEIAMLKSVIALGWIILPIVWMVFCARQPAADGIKNRFPFAAGMFVTLFSCVFLWVSTTGKLAAPAQIILPSAVFAAVTAFSYAMLRGKTVWKEIIAVGVFVLIMLAPPAVVNLNEAVFAWNTTKTPATVVESSGEIKGGGWIYHATADIEGELRTFTVSQETSEQLVAGAPATLVEKTGLLGIDFFYMDWE